jgi:hypothetical protein
MHLLSICSFVTAAAALFNLHAISISANEIEVCVLCEGLQLAAMNASKSLVAAPILVISGILQGWVLMVKGGQVLAAVGTCLLCMALGFSLNGAKVSSMHPDSAFCLDGHSLKRVKESHNFLLESE